MFFRKLAPIKNYRKVSNGDKLRLRPNHITFPTICHTLELIFVGGDVSKGYADLSGKENA